MDDFKAFQKLFSTGLLTFTSSQKSHQYHFINIRNNWTEAQRFCREMYMNSLLKTITDDAYGAYIGLYGEVFRWHWTLPDSFYNEKTFENWKNNQPDKNNNEGCSAMDKNGQWFSDSCDIQRQFVCVNATANKKYILIDENKSWREAQEYCTTFHTDLANVRNVSENQDVKNTAKNDRENTSTQSTQIFTTVPDQDNLILVRENLMWTEAVSYCRKHHVDLVSIHSEELQNRAARKAIQASTSHVWLGLRYTCTFNFWFWIKNREAGCYQNWASESVAM
ncbi:uncharacterized protein LOC107752842 [Sinocyclocheilus rhinocerous]|uniref:uncharacterized protein LOC107752842 n=1 Tax=Sinocyclocheilus rhinocerous TaxID=307959 RepID=UPI0007B85642|nr:PREDICTED: uncharacterized protein LOC107752842 [Sinocyclocheilus rhinocerous]